MKLKFHTEPWKHQLQALKFLMPRDYGALYTDMGSGKTKVLIDLVVNRGFKRTIIVCPKKVCDVWPNEFTKHAPDSRILVLSVSDIPGERRAMYISKKRAEAKFDQEVLVVNYDSIWRHPFKRYLLDKYKADCVICDESHRIKSPGSKVSKFLQALGRRTPFRYLMTGTPLGQSPLDIYAQYRFLAPHIFGTRDGEFQERYANLIPMQGYSILDKRNPYKNLDELHDKMFSCAFGYKVKLDLPPTQDIVVKFDLPARAKKLYKQLKDEGCLELASGTVEPKSVLAIMTRLQQLTSGYMPLEDGGVEEVGLYRVEVLKELIEDIPLEEPIVIFAKYRKDIKNIRQAVTEQGRKSYEVSGKENTLKDWKSGVLVVQIAAGAEGIDLTRARYCVYYTLSHSLLQYKQSRKRVHRPGQTRPVIYYRLAARDTIDERIIKSLDANDDLIQSIMRYKEI